MSSVGPWLYILTSCMALCQGPELTELEMCPLHLDENQGLLGELKSHSWHLAQSWQPCSPTWLLTCRVHVHLRVSAPADPLCLNSCAGLLVCHSHFNLKCLFLTKASSVLIPYLPLLGVLSVLLLRQSVAM